MVLGAGTRWERGSGVGGCHPGRGGLRAGSIRSIPGIGVGVSERGPGTGGNVGGVGISEREGLQEAGGEAGGAGPGDLTGRMLRACVRACVCVCVCLREREWRRGREREREGEEPPPALPIPAGRGGPPPRQADTRSVASAGIRGGPQGRANAGGA